MREKQQSEQGRTFKKTAVKWMERLGINILGRIVAEWIMGG